MNLVLEPLPESKKHQSSSSVESVLSLQNNDNESTANDTNSFGESFDALVEEAGAEARTKTPLYRIRWNPDPMAYVVFAVLLLVISIALAMFYIIHSRSIDQYAGELQAGIDQMDLLLASVSDPVVKATKSLSVASEDDLTVDLPVKMSSDNQRVVSAQVNQSLDSDSIPRSDDPVSLSLAETKVSRLQAMIEKQIEQINFLAEENHELRLRLDFGDDLPAAEPVVHESARGLSSETESKVISINKKQDMRDVTIATIAEIAEDRTGVETGLTPLLEVSTKTAVVTAPVTDASSEKPPTDQLQQTLDRGYQAYNQGDYSAASLWYQRASGLDPMNRDANLGLAAIAGASEQQLTAIGIYRQLLLADPDDQVAFASLLRFASAENEIETELRLHIEQRAAVPAVLHRTFGDYYSRTLQWTRARDAYEQSLLLNTAADVYFNLGISLDHLGQRREAAMRYRQALEAEGESSFDRQLAQDRLSTIGTLD